MALPTVPMPRRSHRTESDPLSVAASGILPVNTVSQWLAGRRPGAALGRQGRTWPQVGVAAQPVAQRPPAATQPDTSSDASHSYVIADDVPWTTEHWEKRNFFTLAFAQQRVEGEYIRWMITAAGSPGPALALGCLVTVTILKTVDLAMAPGVLTSLAELGCLAATAVALWLFHSSSTLRNDSPGPLALFGPARVYTSRRERLAAVGFGLSIAMVMVACCCNGPLLLPGQGPNDDYSYPAEPILFMVIAITTFEIRFALLAIDIFLWSLCLIVGRVALGPFTRPAMTVNWALFAATSTLPLLLLARLKETVLRSHFTFSVKVQLALAESKIHESVMWDIVQRVVPFPLRKRVRSARSWRSIAVLDHATKASVSIATIPNFSNWTGAMQPRDVVRLVCRVFSIFDAVLRSAPLLLQGVSPVIATGDYFLVVGGVIGAGRRDRQRHAKGLFARRLVPEEPEEAAVRRLCSLVEAAQKQQQSTRGMHPSPSFGVAVGFGFGDCWGGLNGRALHHRYVLHGAAIAEAILAVGAGAPNQLLFGPRAADVLLSVAATSQPYARELLMRCELVPHRDIPDRVKILLPRLGTSLGALEDSIPPTPDRDTLVTHGSATGDAEGGDGVTDGVFVDLIDPEDADQAIREITAAEHRIDAIVEVADQTAIRELAAQSGSADQCALDDLTSAQSVMRRVALETQRTICSGAFVKYATEDAFQAYGCRHDMDKSAVFSAALIAFSLAATLSLVLDLACGVTTVRWLSNISALVLYVAAAALSALRHITRHYTRVPVLVHACLSGVVPLFVLLAMQLSDGSLLAESAAAYAVFAATAILFDTQRMQWAARPAVLVVLLCVPLSLVAVFTDRDDVDSPPQVASYVVSWALAFAGLIATSYDCAVNFRRLFVAAMLASRLLNASQMRVRTRESVLEGLLPKHLVRSVATMLQATALEEAAKNAVRDGAAGAGGSSALMGVTLSPFSHEPRCTECWEQLSVTALNFCPSQVVVWNGSSYSETSTQTDGGVLKRLMNSSRSMVESMRILSAVDTAAASIATLATLRVSRAVGDSVIVTHMPAPEDDVTAGAIAVLHFLRLLATLTPRPFTAAATVDLAFGAIIGTSTYQHCVMGDAVRRAEAVLAAVPLPPDGPPQHCTAWCTEVFRNAYIMQYHDVFQKARVLVQDLQDPSVAFGAPQRWRVRTLGSISVFPVPLPEPTGSAEQFDARDNNATVSVEVDGTPVAAVSSPPPPDNQQEGDQQRIDPEDEEPLSDDDDDSDEPTGVEAATGGAPSSFTLVSLSSLMLGYRPRSSHPLVLESTPVTALPPGRSAVASEARRSNPVARIIAECDEGAAINSPAAAADATGSALAAYAGATFSFASQRSHSAAP